MAHLAGTADEIRARVPRALEAWQFMRDNVLNAGLVDPELKRLCFRYVAEDPEVTNLKRFSGRERLALEWTHAIVWDADAADDELWERLHARFSEPELVELGCSIGFALGQQHWERAIGLPPSAGIT
jgi:alkylhydroperoxidase family enzyme